MRKVESQFWILWLIVTGCVSLVMSILGNILVFRVFNFALGIMSLWMSTEVGRRMKETMKRAQVTREKFEMAFTEFDKAVEDLKRNEE